MRECRQDEEEDEDDDDDDEDMDDDEWSKDAFQWKNKQTNKQRVAVVSEPARTIIWSCCKMQPTPGSYPENKGQASLGNETTKKKKKKLEARNEPRSCGRIHTYREETG